MKRFFAFAASAVIALSFVVFPFAANAERECRVFSHGQPGSGRIALTFDDGPSVNTIPILDVLDRYNLSLIHI